MRRGALGWAAATLVVAFLIVLGVPREHRALALYAFLLLAGALVLAGLVAVLALRPAAADARLEGPAALPARVPADLDALEHDVRAALASGVLDERLRALLRAIAAVRLGRAVGDAAAVGDPLARLLAGEQRPLMRQRVSARELAAAVDQLEALR